MENGIKINEQWLTDKLQEAYSKRENLLQTNTNAYRLCFGENDGLPALICDVYAQVAVLKIYSRIWLPLLDEIKAAIVSVTDCEALVLRFSRLVHRENTFSDLTDGQVIYGSLDSEEIQFVEHGVRFNANVIKGHKTGFFLDHRHNRLRIQQLAKGKSVLDVFSYAGGFAIHALVGGARKATALDISKQALAVAENNAKLNEVHLDSIAGDAFTELKKLSKSGYKYDIVIIDPPAFAKAAKEIPIALNQYKRLAGLGMELVAHDGLLVLASCSSRVIAKDFFDSIESALSSSDRSYALVERSFHDTDHPIGFSEGAYLKTAYYKIST